MRKEYVIAELDFYVARYDVAVQHVNNYATGTSTLGYRTRILTWILFKYIYFLLWHIVNLDTYDAQLYAERWPPWENTKRLGTYTSILFSVSFGDNDGNYFFYSRGTHTKQYWFNREKNILWHIKYIINILLLLVCHMLQRLHFIFI